MFGSGEKVWLIVVMWKIRKREQTSGSCHPLLGSSLFQELSRADKYQRPRSPARTQSKKARQDKTRERDLEVGSSENYLGGGPWTSLVCYVWVPSFLQARQTSKSHNTIFDNSWIFSNNWPIMILVINYMSNNISWIHSLRWILTLSIFT